jgi:phosphoribosylanthranilate isomerase
MAQTKICGLTNIDGLNAALEGGARFVGLVFYPRSPRHVTLAHGAALARRARDRAEIVALTVDASDQELDAIREAVAPDWIQAHGSESPARTAMLKAYAKRGVIKALGVARAEDLSAAADYEPVADLLLFDAKPAGAALPGGNAQAFDWTILSGRRFARPWLLAGGLTPDNVAEAIRVSGAALVDVSSGVESAPGLKDPAKIRSFLAAAHAA